MSKKAIVCVDDEPMILRSLRDQITNRFSEEYLCEIAESVEEAWELIEDLHQEGVKLLIIVSDWLMPGTKGDAFLIELHNRFPDVLTILLTGHASEDAVEQVRQYANLYAYIPKPWEEANLLNIIATGLERFN
jgi:DNA-binding NtrC family response regulator